MLQNYALTEMMFRLVRETGAWTSNFREFEPTLSLRYFLMRAILASAIAAVFLVVVISEIKMLLKPCDLMIEAILLSLEISTAVKAALVIVGLTI